MARFIRRAVEVEAQQFNPADLVNPQPIGLKVTPEGRYMIAGLAIRPGDWVTMPADGGKITVIDAADFAREFEPTTSTLAEHLVTSSGTVNRLDLPADLTEAEARHCLEGNFADFATTPAGFYVQGRKVDEGGFKAAVAKVAVAIPFKDGGGEGRAVGWISRGPVPAGFAV